MPDKAILCYICSWKHGFLHVYSFVAHLAFSMCVLVLRAIISPARTHVDNRILLQQCFIMLASAWRGRPRAPKRHCLYTPQCGMSTPDWLLSHDLIDMPQDRLWLGKNTLLHMRILLVYQLCQAGTVETASHMFWGSNSSRQACDWLGYLSTSTFFYFLHYILSWDRVSYRAVDLELVLSVEGPFGNKVTNSRD